MQIKKERKQTYRYSYTQLVAIKPAKAPGQDSIGTGGQNSIGANTLADQTLEIVDTATIEEVQLAKLRTDIRLKLAAKHNRVYYGDAQSPLLNIDLGGLALDALRKRQV